MMRAPGRLLTLLAALAAAAVVRAQDAPGVVTTLPRPDELARPLEPPPGPIPDILPPPCDDFAPLRVVTGPAPGLTAAVEFGFLYPHVKHSLVSPVTLEPGGFPDIVALPFTAEQDGTVAPKVTLGWRLRDGRGAFLLNYRNLASEGREVIGDFDALGDGLLRSRLDMNFVGLDYSTREAPLGALWGLRWELGTQLASVYTDSHAQGLVLGQRSSNWFLGAGPHVALDLTRELPGTGLALFARTDTAVYMGRIRQRFAETVGDPTRPAFFGSASDSGPQAVPHVILQAGLSWLSHPDGRYRLTLGYQWEQLWAVGTLGASSADVRAQGLFLRTEFNF